jgi:hypothetical protein
MPKTVNWCMGGTSSTKLDSRLANTRGKGPEAERQPRPELAAASSAYATQQVVATKLPYLAEPHCRSKMR